MEKNKPIERNTPIYVAGHRGMVGSAFVSGLKNKGYTNIITRSHSELDLTDQTAVKNFFNSMNIGYIVLAAAKVGGIHANKTYPADFIYHNLMIETNVIHSAYQAGIRRLLFLGSSCIYPRLSKQPIKEEYLLTGLLEPTNESYAIAKITGIKLCEAYNRQYGTNYRCAMPTNLYGPGDNYDLMNSHVLAALIRKFHLAQLALKGDWEMIKKDESMFGTIPEDIRKDLSLNSVTAKSNIQTVVRLWGSGAPRRELLHVSDLAEAGHVLMSISDEQYDMLCSNSNTEDGNIPVTHINIGTGQDLTIRSLAEAARNVVEYNGEVIWDNTRPDGMPQKLLDISRIKQTGWRPAIKLIDGIRDTYNIYMEQLKQVEHR